MDGMIFDMRSSKPCGSKQVDPVVRAGVMDHRKVELGPEVYDHCSA